MYLSSTKICIAYNIFRLLKFLYMKTILLIKMIFRIILINQLFICYFSIFIESNEIQFLIYQIFYIERVRHHFWNTAVWRKKKWGKSSSIKMTSFSIWYFLTTRYQIRNISKYTQAIFCHRYFQHCEILHIFNLNFLSWKRFAVFQG